MLVKPSLSEQALIDCLKLNYGLEVSALRFLPLGADTQAWSYRAETREQVFFLKLKRCAHYDLGLRIINFLVEAGIKELIPPLKTLQGHSAQRMDDFMLSVYPFIEGENGFNQALADEQWRALGRALRHIHEITVPEALQQELRREAYSSQWRDLVRSLYSQSEMKDAFAENLALFMQKNKQLIHRLVDRSEQLAQELQKERHQFVLCHSDLHGGNVLLQGEQTLFIVDWDDPIMAPKERDLMFIGGGVGNVWNKPQEEALFYQGYGKTEIKQQILAYYRHERIVEDLAIYGRDLLLTAAGGENRAEMYKQFLAMFEPRGVVDIALLS